MVDDLELDRERIGLRQQANYWQAQHARVCERERFWKEKAHALEATVLEQAAQIAQSNEEKEKLKARVFWLEQQVFGRKSEKTKPDADPDPDPDPDPSTPEVGEADPTASGSPDDPRPEEKRKRGKKKGAKGFGRKRYEELFTEEILHDLPEGEKQCPKCGKAFGEFPGTEDSQEIHWEVRLVRYVHRRKRYVRSCSCDACTGIVTAPGPPKLIPKGLFSTGFWVRILLEKFLFQRPLYRIRKTLELEGLFVSQGTLTGGLQRLGELLQPLYAKILERSRTAKHWHMDETRWLVFVEVEGKRGNRWWLWVVITHDTCAYLLDPSRSASVPKNHLGENTKGIISADRYSAYKVLEAEGHFRIAFCWFHVRRDFVRIQSEYGKLRAWAEEWLKRIHDLFERNTRRLEAPRSSEQFQLEDQGLRKALALFEETYKSEILDTTIHRVAKKALVSLQNHWGGLTLFVDQPEIPMDNNESERRLRNPVVGRKNYYGSGSIWSGTLAAVLFTLFQTLLLNQIDPQKHMTAYFEACAQNGGKPPKDLEAFLPWNLSEERKAAWRYPPKHNAEAPEDKPP